MAKIDQSQRETQARVVNHTSRFQHPRATHRKWDIMLAVAAGEDRRDIASQFDVSLGYISRVAVEYGLSARSRRSSSVAVYGDKASIYVGATEVRIDPQHAEGAALAAWWINQDGYVASGTFGLLHRWVMRANDRQEIDHIDGDLLNNCTDNLRVVERFENNRNRHRLAHAPTIFKGVSRRGERWQAAISDRGSRIILGTFSHPVNAALAYDAAARSRFGVHARLNFPEHGEQSALLRHDEAELIALIRCTS